MKKRGSNASEKNSNLNVNETSENNADDTSSVVTSNFTETITETNTMTTNTLSVPQRRDDENDSSMGTSELQERIEASPGFWRRLFNRRGSRTNDASSVGTTPADGSVRAKAVRKSLDFLAYF